MTFTDEQQQRHRAEFIREYRQKAWGAACHAEWVAKGLDSIAAEYGKLQEEERGIHDELIKLKDGLDNHTDENQAKRKTLRDRREAIQRAIEALGKNMQQGQQALQGLYQSIEASLQLAKHAETWEWKESTAK
jgi:uncharacterized protein HemX